MDKLLLLFIFQASGLAHHSKKYFSDITWLSFSAGGPVWRPPAVVHGHVAPSLSSKSTPWFESWHQGFSHPYLKLCKPSETLKWVRLSPPTYPLYSLHPYLRSPFSLTNCFETSVTNISLHGHAHDWHLEITPVRLINVKKKIKGGSIYTYNRSTYSWAKCSYLSHKVAESDL